MSLKQDTRDDAKKITKNL